MTICYFLNLVHTLMVLKSQQQKHYTSF